MDAMLTPEEIASTLNRRIAYAVARALRSGLRLRTGARGVGVVYPDRHYEATGSAVCPVGALLLVEPRAEWSRINRRWDALERFADGFDYGTPGRSLARRLGAAWRARAAEAGWLAHAKTEAA